MISHQTGIFFKQGESNRVVQLGDNSVIDEGVILGYPTVGHNGQLLVIGAGARIRSGTVIYSGSHIGARLETGHNVVIRERNTIGDNLRIWGNAVIDYGCIIGHNVKIHNNVYVTQFTTLEDDVFLGPGVCISNDIHPGCPKALECLKGPTIKKGAQIGINSCVLPRVVVGEYAVIGAGSIVTHDIPSGMVAYGNPARVICKITDLACTSGLIDKPYNHLEGRIESANSAR